MKRVLCFIFCTILIFSMLTVANAQTETKLIAMTFDDGPSKYTVDLLNGLKDRDAKATFFIAGNRAGSNMSTIERMVAEGHQIGNHSYSHADLTTLSAQGMQNELNSCRNYLVKAGGEQTYMVRPPYGSYNQSVRNNANAPLILWSVDTLDWKHRNADTVYNNIINNAKDGSIVLCHDLYSTSVEGALRAIDTLKSRGYEFVTVSELLRRRDIPIENGKTYSSAYNKGVTLPPSVKPKNVEINTESVMGGKKVTLSCPTKDTSIYYTTDGSNPTNTSKKYTEPFLVTKVSDIKAVAFTSIAGDISSKKVWVEPAKLPGLDYKDGVLTLAPADDTTVYYTTNGSAPNDKSKVYSKPITITKTVSALVRQIGKADNTITYTLTAHGDLLTDIRADAWYYSAISDCMHYGIMKGTTAYEFSPKNTVTRAMFTTVLYRLSGETQSTYNPANFTDIKQNTWYSDAVNWAQTKGIVSGVSGNKFAPNNNITREEMCTMLARFFTSRGYEFALTDREVFVDASAISDWAKTSVDTLYRAKLINGIGNGIFAPKNTATRAECAKLSVDTYNSILMFE